jgi:hypothetical protein
VRVCGLIPRKSRLLLDVLNGKVIDRYMSIFLVMYENYGIHTSMQLMIASTPSCLQSLQRSSIAQEGDIYIFTFFLFMKMCQKRGSLVLLRREVGSVVIESCLPRKIPKAEIFGSLGT